MKTLATLIAAGTLGISGAAVAQVNEPAPTYKVAPMVQVLERNARGKATRVAVRGQAYAVCMNDRQDSCIQPRAAGLGFGDRPMQYWPGEPVSSRG